MMSAMRQGMRRHRWASTIGVVTLAGAATAVLIHAVGSGPPASSATPAPVRPMGGVDVVGGRLVTAGGRAVQLGGVVWSGAEYACLGGHGAFAGPTGPAAVAAVAEWHVDAVRVPLNEDCWLGINRLPAASSGATYRRVVALFVHLLEDRGIVVDLDLHWSAPGSQLATGQQDMADADHSVRFWQEVAAAFRSDPYVIFELYNEPHGISWSCWRDGCMVPPRPGTRGYRAAGMQQLVDAVRAAEARNPLLLDGLAHATDLSGWRAHEPDDPAHALVAAWHVYGPAGCGPSCWQRTVSGLHGAPMLVTEFGETDCRSAFVDEFMTWLDGRGIGYLAWAWNPWQGCHGPSLIDSYAGVPYGAYGVAVMRHLKARFPAS